MTHHHEPVYVAWIVDEYCTSDNVFTATATSFDFDNVWDFSPPQSEMLLAYDGDGFEIMRFGFLTPGAFTTTIDGVERGLGGTEGRAFADETMISHPIAVLSTHDIEIDGVPVKTCMEMPSGHTCSLLYQEGRTNIGGVKLNVLDKDNYFTKKQAGFSVNGKRVVIMAGYVGFDISDFEIVYVGAVRDLTYQAGKYSLSVETDFAERLNQELYGGVEDFSSTLDGAVLLADTDITLADSTWAWDWASALRSTGAGGYAGIFFKIDDEWMAYDTAGHAPPDAGVVRAQLGTSAADHDNGKAVDMAFVIQDNPVNILLMLLLTRTAEYGRQHATYDLFLGDANDEPLGINWYIADLDVAQFEEVRDTWFASDVYEIVITGREKMRPFIEKHLLKPMNANLYIGRTGKLSLAAIAPPLPDAYFVTLTEDDIIGAPGLSLSNESIINDVTVDWEYDALNDTYANTTVVLDATSQSEYDRDGTIKVEARGVSSRWSGSTVATAIANRKLRNFKNPQPTIKCSVLFHKGAVLEPGRSVGFINSVMPEVTTGHVGINATFIVASRNINWATGLVDLELVRTNYGTGRTGLIAPAETVDYTDASDEAKAKYMFISADNGKMTNGDGGYSII